MQTSRDDVGIAIRSAFLQKGTQQRFSLFALIIISVILIFFESVDAKPLNYFRAILKDTIYRGSALVSYPSKVISSAVKTTKSHIDLYKNYNELVKENDQLKSNIFQKDFLILENTQLRKLIDEQASSSTNLTSARVLLDKQSPYLNSFIINNGANKKIKNGMEVMHGNNFIGRIVDVNFFSSRILLISDLNSKIPVLIEPQGYQAIMSGNGSDTPSLDYLPDNHKIKDGDKVYTSGREGIFTPGIPIGEVKIKIDNINISLFSDLKQVTFVNINLGKELKK